jgi:hypothetical protein
VSTAAEDLPDGYLEDKHWKAVMLLDLQRRYRDDLAALQHKLTCAKIRYANLTQGFTGLDHYKVQYALLNRRNLNEPPKESDTDQAAAGS